MIHYFLDGDVGYDYRSSWMLHMPGVELVHWNCRNIPLDEYPELIKFVDEKKYSVLSDFVRRWAVYKHGGIYLDFDVELVRPIDQLFELYSFVCIEGLPIYANAAVTGGVSGNKHHLAMLDDYLDVIRGNKGVSTSIEIEVGPKSATDYVTKIKGEPLDQKDLINVNRYDGLITLPKRYFYPFNWNESFSPDCVTQDTLGIHWWKKGWG
jgi:mannosyltransferase OCH1-like enzyme